jgi:peptidyl-prolyl cis-trans isomerase SurA
MKQTFAPGTLWQRTANRGSLASLGLLLALFWSPAPAQAAEELEWINAVAAIANDSVITMHDVRQASAPALDFAQRTYFNDPQQYRKKRDEAIGEAVELLLERQLILHEFKTAGGNLPDSIIDDEIKDRIRQQFGDRATLIKNLQAQGLTYESYRQRTREEIILTYMDRKNVREALLISPAKIEKYYQENLPKYKLADQIQLRMISLNRPAGASADEIKTVALDIRSKILQGASFAEMATSYSEGSQRRDGGLLPWVEETALSPLSRLALDLPPGQCSKVIGLGRESDDSYWLYEYDGSGVITKGRKYTGRDIFVEERKIEPGKAAPDLGIVSPQAFYLLAVDGRRVAHTKALTEVRDEIERELLVKERARLRKKWIERLKNRSYVTYF